MLVPALLLAATAIAAPLARSPAHIQVKDADLCLSSAGSFDRDTPLQLAACGDTQDQAFTWEPSRVDAGVQYYRIRSEGGLCVASKIPRTFSSPRPGANVRARLLVHGPRARALRAGGPDRL